MATDNELILNLYVMVIGDTEEEVEYHESIGLPVEVEWERIKMRIRASEICTYNEGSEEGHTTIRLKNGMELDAIISARKVDEFMKKAGYYFLGD